MTDAKSGHDTQDFVMERVFAAPPETVWKAWTDPELLVRWYKPNQNCETKVVSHDLKPGGVMIYEMRFGEMPPHRERWEFEHIDPPERLQWKQMLADADGNATDNPRMPDWPRVLLTTIHLEAHEGGTLQRLTWEPFDATEAEMACFREASAMPKQGWAGGLDNLGALLEELA